MNRSTATRAPALPVLPLTRASRVARSAAWLVFAPLVVASLVSCHDESKDVGTADTIFDPGDTALDISFDVTTQPFDVDTASNDGDDAAETDGGPNACAVAGGFGCPCSGAGDCLDGICLEGPDGSICSQACIEQCPEGFDCLTTAIGGSDPQTVCVPRHTRLCRPCMTSSDCNNPVDPNPAVCLADPDPAVGSFCATSCAQIPCPEGYSCEDVPVGEGTQRLCLPNDDACDCRPAWTDLLLTTSCAIGNENGTCFGTRTCGGDGLTACSAKVPAPETCNLLDDNCDASMDNVLASACENTNVFGTCSGTSGCTAEGESVCNGQVPAAEVCNGSDDDCDGLTDEVWDNCLPAGCGESNGVYFETGAPSCVGGQCAYQDPVACGLYTCSGGGDAGDVCASSCNDDTTCVAEAHCNEATHTCVDDVLDGGACGDASDCGSGHCQNGFCCRDGDCCHQPADCPADYREAARCDTAAECQGSRKDSTCVESMCGTSEAIGDDSGCSAQTLAVDCTPNVPKYCNGAKVQTAPTCATTCGNDSDCANGFHCDGTCKPDVVDGQTCDEDTDCVSDHCENGFCCGDGACCGVAADCPNSFRDPAQCNDTVTCQGDRIDATCVAHICDSVTAQDDSGCDENVEANTCGAFDSAYCNGAVTQSPPQCKFTCTTDDECDANFHCDVVCVPNLPDGNFCDEGSDCVSAHCANNLCCASGDCCNRADDCPDSYTGLPQCDNTATCQGTREGPICSNHVCDKIPGVADDSACGNAVVASDCGAYPSVRCAGGPNQQAPVCADSCSSNGECDTESYCESATHKCKPKKDPGSACTDSAQCDTGHCQNGYCCGSGDCCAAKTDCSPAVYGTASVCTDIESCQGEKKEPACSATFQCQIGLTVGDDSACAGSESDTCGYFESVFCSAATNQTKPNCRTSCGSDNQCDDGAHCENGNCVPDQGVGGACELTNTCQNGLTCVDHKCCESTCTGACRRCDVDGSPGVCSAPTAGSDPDNDCGAVSCTGYYFGFTDKTCYARADLAADVVSCGGDGACQAASDLCPTAAKGDATSSCHAICQIPAEGSCQGTTPGACTNVTGGTQTCGVGACTNTVDRCSDGAPATCTPKPKGTEVCNGIDDDCDGLTDAADPDMTRIACDNQNGVCNGSMRPASLCVGGNWQPCTDAVYLAYSPKYEAGKELTCDGGTGVDNDCDGAVDDDFTYTGPDGGQVRGAGKACGVGVCAGGTTRCAVNNTLVCSTDNLIVSESCDAKDNDCDGKTDSLDPSLVMVNCGNQTGVCAGAKTTARLCAAGSWSACQADEYEANNPLYESDETLCDGKDNDCNNLTDDGLTAPLNSNQKGVCAGSKQSCGGTNGWQDQYSSATIANYDANESVPDANFRDENCDGVDGNVNNGIFVAQTEIICIFGNCFNVGGVDGSTCGTSLASGWCATVKYAVENRSSARSQIYVRRGTYNDGAIVVPGNVSIFGGYDTNWLRDQRGVSGHEVRIGGGSTGTEGNAVTIFASGSKTVNLADLILNGVNASGTFNGLGRSSYVVYAGSSTTLNVTRCDVAAGNGAGGGTGSSGSSASGSPANGGGQGGGAIDGSVVPLSCQFDRAGGGGGGSNNSCNTSFGNPGGGGGGTSGMADESNNCGCCGCFVSVCWCCTDATGGFGGGNASVATGGFGIGGGGGGTCAAAGDGSDGRVTDASGGGGASGSKGYLSAGFWWGFDGASGGLGSNGGGGGGGGGSGGCDNNVDQPDTSGAGGGGGGAGGCRAPAAGGAGRGAGGSFGIFAYQATVNVNGSTITRGVGGTGGTGGSGGSGQPGGSAGAGGGGRSGSRPGGQGGAGGRGGHSGAGGGGAGGISYGIFSFSSTVNQSSNSFNGGGGGAGGQGGSGTTSTQFGGVGTSGAGSTVGTCSAAGGC